MNRFIAVIGLAFLCIAASQAGLTVSYVNATNAGGGIYDYNYEFTLAPNDELNPPSIAGAKCLSASGTAPCTNTTFATIYDIPNLVSSSVPASQGWGAVTQFVGITPVTSSSGPENPPNGDDASLENVTFYYTGATVYCGSSTNCTGTVQTVFTGFDVGVSGGLGLTSSTPGSYTSSVTNAQLYNNGTGLTGINAVDYASGSLLIPIVGSPEPSTIALLGLGLVGLGFARKKIRG